MGMLDKLKDIHSMRKEAKELQSALAKEQMTGVSKDGHFRVTLDGNQNIIRVEIDPAIVGDLHRLEADAKDAFARALDALKKLMASKFSSFLKRE
ncbi:YbaB/EbfC family nucleoid-associated protein [Candidatus Uhrbacteria bacterium]|nr:YbaB/EbfC family nucleoid-associated protein [Candidatus Uhrbacteria bacterium]